ncbi:MAG: hypothetical protein JSW52_03070 [Candidatus Coatesbacteria bacterium]|nr:MAG: hypothetical protein JSW52_03070 [Candidatus Coatesbacteria bacterium]
MSKLRNRYIPLISIVAATVIVAGCGVDYALPAEYLSDGELLSESMDDAASKLVGTPSLTMGGPYVLTNLDEIDEEYSILYNRFEDALADALGETEVGVVSGGEDDGADSVKYRLLECRVLNEKSSRGKVKRVGHTIAHIRIFHGDEMVWAGEIAGSYENEVPKGVISKLVDERITEIGPQAPEKGKNPFIEPLLVTGITGALIYLFAVSAQ